MKKFDIEANRAILLESYRKIADLAKADHDLDPNEMGVNVRGVNARTEFALFGMETVFLSDGQPICGASEAVGALLGSCIVEYINFALSSLGVNNELERQHILGHVYAGMQSAMEIVTNEKVLFTMKPATKDVGDA